MKLFPINEPKSISTNRLIDPLILRRSLHHELNKTLMGINMWRQNRMPVQANALRSFNTLQHRFEKDLKLIILYLNNGDYTLSEAKRASYKLFYDYYKRAYFLGLKGSGVGLSLAYSTLSFKFSGNPMIYKEEERWTKTASAAESKFWGKVLTKVSYGLPINIDKRINMYVKSLEGHYLAGKVAGAPSNSLIYWVKSSNYDTCTDCTQFVKLSPFVKELLPTTPKAGMCQCLYNCGCNLKIVSASREDYLFHKNRLLINNQALSH